MMDINDSKDAAGTDEAFRELLGIAEPRPVPPAEDAATVRAAVEAEWRQVTAARRTRRRGVALALAATVAVAVFGALNLLWAPAPHTATVAAVQKQFGTVSINGARAAAALAIDAGDRVATASSSGLVH